MQEGIAVDLSAYRAESHVRSALTLAVQMTSHAPVDAALWLRAALQVAPVSPSGAFKRLGALLQVDGAPLEGKAQEERRLDLKALLVTPALGRSIEIAKPFLSDARLWGRDYVSIGLLAEEPGVVELAAGAGLSASELRRKWFDFVQRDDGRRSSDAWSTWWAAAGISSDLRDPTDFSFTPDAPEYTPGLASILRTAAAASTVVSTVDVLFALASLGQPGREPTWAADFVLREVSAYPRFEAESKRLRPASSEKSPAGRPTAGARVHATSDLKTCLERAGVLARLTTGGKEVAGRHLLAALITKQQVNPEPASSGLLREVGVDIALLRQRLYDWVRGFGDDDAVWLEALVGGGPPPRQRAGFNADATTGPDLLNIEPEVQALATLIAARDSVPPLSVGLFGDWGSGKTFFMRRLQSAIGTLSREARQAGAMQRDLPFYKRVVQIEFNAWHYVEGNLWASLVEHILSNLRVSDDERPTVTEELQRHWIGKLGFAEQARSGAESARLEAERGVSQARDELDRARQEHEARTTELARLSAASVRRDFQLSGAARVVREALAPLGLERVGEGAIELQAALSHARGVLQHGHAVLTPLLQAPDRAARWRRLMFVLVGSPLAALLVGWVMSQLGKDVLAQLTAAATGAATLLTSGAAWLRNQATWMSEQVKRVDEAQKQYDADMREQLAQTEAAKARKEQELVLAQQKLAQAEQTVEQAGQRVQQAAADLEAATTTRLLGQFIQDRAASSDYRKHLGVLAVVREDFEKLSRFIDEENWRLAPAAKGDDRYAKTLRKITTLQEEEADAAVRINRIVLYVDDLDRCPPAKVVDVLQAVHLLLAFPLFVVVVGVDARWISRSLETRYKELLHSGEAREPAQQLFEGARSQDYLEKIFQIPLWLRSMNRADAQRMVYSMLGQDERPKGEVTEAPAAPEANDAGEAATPAPQGAATGTSPVAPAGDAGASAERRPEAAAHVDQAKQMRVGPHEHEIIDSLAPLLGRSPRSLKRFVNVYRLIKAGLTPAELAGFAEPDPQGVAPCGAVLLLLAVDTGLPRLSRDLYEALEAGVGSQNGVEDLVSWFDSRHGGRVEWVGLRDWLLRLRGRLNAATMVRLAHWGPRVARYSFKSPMGDVRG